MLIPLIQRKNGLHVILTQRALHLKHHAGQISFPGGKVELTDDSLAHTALRETEEEIGIRQKEIQLVGNLASLTTSTGYHITPFI
ncbi:CoA pyrophosphatase, partial [Psychromonas sp.]|nr:CoA pyrophosphatase [Psychromonas sp.]